jgi:hypothetical protein
MHLFVIYFAKLVLLLTLSHDQPLHNTRMWMGVLIVLRHWHLCDWFWAWLSICAHFAAMKQCFHIVLKVCDGFLLLVHIQPTKITSLHAALLWCVRKAGSNVNSAVTTVWLAYKVWKYFMIMKGVLTLSSATNTTSFKISDCGEFLTHICIIFEIFASLQVHTVILCIVPLCSLIHGN